MSPLDEETIEASLARINAGLKSKGSSEVFEQYKRVKLSAPSVQPMPKSVDCERVIDLVGVGQGFKRALSLRYIPGWSQPSA
jgi:hypothetical protein